MSLKEQCQRKVANEKAIAIITIALLLCVFCIVVAIMITSKKTVYASIEELEQIETADDLTASIDIMNLLDENTKISYREEYETQQIDLEYMTDYEENANLPKGMVQVLQEGRDGLQTVTIKKVYEGDTLVKEEEASRKIIEASVNKIVQVGTGPYKSNYDIRVGDTIYTTPYTLGVYVEPDKDSEKVLTIEQDSEVKVQDIVGEWYKITYSFYTGYAPANCFTYLKPKSLLSEDVGEEESYTKEQLLAKLSFTMSLDEPSGFTQEQFRQVLSGNSADKNKIFENNADYFYYAEKQYGVNGIFLAAVGIHESGWGTSAICLNKRNLFGYGAYDASPYSSAYSYSDYAESIDLIARVFMKYYLKPASTQIYEGNIASGAYYNGATLTGVNTRYATDKNWANAVYNHMKTLYNRL